MRRNCSRKTCMLWCHTWLKVQQCPFLSTVIFLQQQQQHLFAKVEYKAVGILIFRPRAQNLLNFFKDTLCCCLTKKVQYSKYTHCQHRGLEKSVEFINHLARIIISIHYRRSCFEARVPPHYHVITISREFGPRVT